MSDELKIGDSIHHYRIAAKIGEGGMGVVYRANDPKIGRDVAIKVLPAELSGDADRLRRFELEARSAGSLNHPNILVIHEIGTHDGAPYIVSELLEGETLTDRISGSTLPTRKAVDYALQIARGLAAAHEKAIVHRDLKPDNIFITNDGRIKILDFGLAKLLQPTDAVAVQTDAATRRLNTAQGAVMGTAGYMSPEQVRGREIDHRTDIFSFGAVLYEMLSGRRAFRGDTAADMVSAILKENPPDLSDTDHHINPGLDRVVRRCLEKNREERFHSASDLAFAIESLSEAHSSGSTLIASHVATSQGPMPRIRSKLGGSAGWIAAAIFLASTIALTGMYLSRSAPVADTMRFELPMPDKTTFGDGLALSPDGRRLVFVANGGSGEKSLRIRSIDSPETREMAGTEGAAFPFWSPDSRYIGFFAGSKLKKVEASGGPVQTLADATIEARGGAWGADGNIIFTPGYLTPLFKVSAGGGAVQPLTELVQSASQTSHRWPTFLPDGRRYLYFARSTQPQMQGIYAASLDSSEHKLLVNTTVAGAFAADTVGGTSGHLLYIRDNSLLAQPFDSVGLTLSGDPVSLAEGVMNHPGDSGPTAYSAFSVSSNGRLAYITGSTTVTQLEWHDRTGKNLAAVGQSGDFHEMSLSPDGKKIVFGRADDIWLMDLTRDTMTRFTFEPLSDVCPLWSPDGSRVVYSSNRGGLGKMQIYQKNSGGAGSDELLLASDGNAFAGNWIKTDKGEEFIVYDTEHDRTLFDIHILPLFGKRQPIVFLNSPFNEAHPRFSPDGRYIAYVSDESGRPEIYVQTFPASGGKWQISTAGGDQPQWRQDGKELFYIAPGKGLASVEVTPGANFEVGAAVTLFTTRVPLTSMTDDRNNYIATPDGQRFMVNNLVDGGNTQPITFVLNWTAGLKK